MIPPGRHRARRITTPDPRLDDDATTATGTPYKLRRPANRRNIGGWIGIPTVPLGYRRRPCTGDVARVDAFQHPGRTAAAGERPHRGMLRLNLTGGPGSGWRRAPDRVHRVADDALQRVFDVSLASHVEGVRARGVPPSAGRRRRIDRRAVGPCKIIGRRSPNTTARSGWNGGRHRPTPDRTP